MIEEQFQPDWFSKPSDSILSQMRRRNVTVSELAASLDGGIDAIRNLLTGFAAIDDHRARSLSDALGGTPGFWLKRQKNYESALERVLQAVSDAEKAEWLERVPDPAAAASRRAGSSETLDEIRRRLVFFNVNNIRSWKTRYGCVRSDTQFRTSPTLFSDEKAVSLWLRHGELEASLCETKLWSREKLLQNLAEVRRLSKLSQPARFLPRLKALCAEFGVALVILRAPKGCRASGAIRFINPEKAMLLLSFRFRADDQFWFTVFHELGHLALHGSGTFVDDDETLQDERETEANQFARACIIPESREEDFQRLEPKREEVVRFSMSIGVAPGLIVGQMQYRKMIGPERLNRLKRRWGWDQIGARQPTLRSE